MANSNTVDTRRVFVSSTTKDLQQYRDVAVEVINAVSTSTGGNRFTLKPVSMDIKTQDGERATALEASQTWVRNECDWVVLIVAWNYGYVPDGEVRSVTESEYRAAIAENKKVFVFIPGEKGDNEKAYRVCDRESVDLKDWLSNDQHRPALDAFKAELRKSRLDLFRNLDDFRDRLAETLRQSVTEEVFQGIATTIDQLDLQPQLRDCLDEVLQLARLKRLHDTLHQIRQFGIRTWREQLVTSWPDDGDPPFEAQIKYLKGAPGIVKLVERISNVVAELPDGVKKGLPKLNRVVMFTPPWCPNAARPTSPNLPTPSPHGCRVFSPTATVRWAKAPSGSQTSTAGWPTRRFMRSPRRRSLRSKPLSCAANSNVVCRCNPDFSMCCSITADGSASTTRSNRSTRR